MALGAPLAMTKKKRDMGKPLAKVPKTITAGSGCATIIVVFCGTGALAGDKNRLLQEARVSSRFLPFALPKRLQGKWGRPNDGTSAARMNIRKKTLSRAR
jgi:hypothetical protein